MGGVMIIGYDTFKNIAQDNFTSLLDPGPDVLICDEGHVIKNANTKLRGTLDKVKTNCRVLLTGTPMQNNIDEFYWMIEFVKPNLLGTRDEFSNAFSKPISNGIYKSDRLDTRIMNERSYILHQVIDSCVHRLDESVLKSMVPPKKEYVLHIRLTPIQIKLYEVKIYAN